MQMLDSIFTKTHCSGTWTLTPLQHARNFQKDQEEQRTARTQKSLRTRTYEKSQNSIVIPVCDKKEENPQVESYSSWNCGQVNPFPYGSFFALLHCEANSSFRASFETLSLLFFWNSSCQQKRFRYSKLFFPSPTPSTIFPTRVFFNNTRVLFSNSFFLI